MILFYKLPMMHLITIPECEYLIEGEFTNNHNIITLSLLQKELWGMGDGQRLSAGCHFFIVISEHVTFIFLNDKFTAFGKVIEGYEYIEQIY